MAPPEPSNPTTAKPEHCNAAETQEDKLKNYFMMMIEALKEETKNSLKEVEEKTNKKIGKKINDSLRESKEIQEKKSNR